MWPSSRDESSSFERQRLQAKDSVARATFDFDSIDSSRGLIRQALSLRAPLPLLAMSDPRLYRFPNMVFIMLQPTKRLTRNTASFRVPLNVNKRQIANYLEQLYAPTNRSDPPLRVRDVRTMIYLGKRERTAEGWGKKPDWKKAYVTFEGDCVSPHFKGSYPNEVELQQLQEIGKPVDNKEEDSASTINTVTTTAPTTTPAQ